MASLELLSALAGGTGAFAEHRQREAELAEFLRQEMAKLELRRQIEEIRQGAQTGREELRQTRQDERQKTKIEADREKEDLDAKRKRKEGRRERRSSATMDLVKELSRAATMGVQTPEEIPKRPLEMAGLAAALRQQVEEIEKQRASDRIKDRRPPPSPKREPGVFTQSQIGSAVMDAYSEGRNERLQGLIAEELRKPQPTKGVAKIFGGERTPDDAEVRGQLMLRQNQADRPEAQRQWLALHPEWADELDKAGRAKMQEVASRMQGGLGGLSLEDVSIEPVPMDLQLKVAQQFAPEVQEEVLELLREAAGPSGDWGAAELELDQILASVRTP